MNIAIEDIVHLERKYGEESTKGIVWFLATKGLTVWDIDEVMEMVIERKPTSSTQGGGIV